MTKESRGEYTEKILGHLEDLGFARPGVPNWNQEHYRTHKGMEIRVRPVGVTLRNGQEWTVFEQNQKWKSPDQPKVLTVVITK